ncbi:MAG: regulatory protein FmdB family [Frankiales bacterium]|nr:regulatory protein FmdB family [Frankiales bacterium]
MPTYQYACTACGESLEAVQSFSDAALTECPACGGALRKVFSAVGVVFKGSGFYKTDSRSPGKKDAPVSSETKSETKTETKSDTKTDSKPAAAKTETKAAPASTSTPAA